MPRDWWCAPWNCIYLTQTTCIPMKSKEQILAWTAFAFFVLQVFLVLMSWIVNSTMPTLPVRSLLSSEGIRWFLGNFVSNLSTPFLVWMLLLSVAWGELKESGMQKALSMLFKKRKLMYRQRFALWVVLLLLMVYVAFIGFLTCAPHAILLSSTGDLFPSSFSASIVPIIAFGISFLSISYGVISGAQAKLTDIFRGLTAGGASVLPFGLLYILAAQLYFSLSFVLNINM